MTDEVEHVDNDTPTASDDDVKRMDKDTEQNANPGAAVDQQGVGNNPGESTDPDSEDDPKSGGTPVHAAPSEDSPQS
jgi:hypothetical protein